MTGEGLFTVLFPHIFLQVFQTRLVSLDSKATFSPFFWSAPIWSISVMSQNYFLCLNHEACGAGETAGCD